MTDVVNLGSVLEELLVSVARFPRLANAAGGDGSVGEVVGGLVGTAVPLGIIPVGTGNLLARVAGHLFDMRSYRFDLDLDRGLSSFFGRNGAPGLQGHAHGYSPRFLGQTDTFCVGRVDVCVMNGRSRLL